MSHKSFITHSTHIFSLSVAYLLIVLTFLTFSKFPGRVYTKGRLQGSSGSEFKAPLNLQLVPVQCYFKFSPDSVTSPTPFLELPGAVP